MIVHGTPAHPCRLNLHCQPISSLLRIPHLVLHSVDLSQPATQNLQQTVIKDPSSSSRLRFALVKAGTVLHHIQPRLNPRSSTSVPASQYLQAENEAQAQAPQLTLPLPDYRARAPLHLHLLHSRRLHLNCAAASLRSISSSIH